MLVGSGWVRQLFCLGLTRPFPTMGELSAKTEANWESFGRRWFSTLVAIFLWTVHDPALALDLATETLASAGTRWEQPPADDRGLVNVIGFAAGILARAVERRRVPATERRRYGLAPYRLT